MKDSFEKSILLLLSKRAAAASICPSDVARHLLPAGAWRELMPKVLAVAAQLALSGRLRITRADEELDPLDLTGGPVRLRRGPKFTR